MFDGQLNDFFDLLDLLVYTSNHLVCAVRGFLHTHELNQGVNLARQDFVEHVAVALERNACVGLAIINRNVLVNVDDILTLLTNLHQNFLLAHGLDHLTAVGGWLQQHVQLLA